MMGGEAWTSVLPWLGGILGAVLLFSLLRRPMGALLRLAARTGVGLAFLALFSPIGAFLGSALGVNLFNALVLGVLGAPGFGLLLMLKWVLH